MALAEGVREIVDSIARDHGARRVAVVRLEIGRLAQVEVEAMRFAFEVVKRGSLADGARLDIVEADGTAWCLPCAQPVPLAARGDACPRCGSHQLQVTGGDRMRVQDIEIE
jgi:hydrogenase nickel incorporation protein HypA/HybF